METRMETRIKLLIAQSANIGRLIGKQ